MKKILLITALTMMGSLAYGSTAASQDLDVTLETQVKMGINAWWDEGNEHNDIPNKSNFITLPTMSPGQEIKDLPLKHIRLVGPKVHYSHEGNVHLEVLNGKITLTHESDPNYSVDIPLRILDKSIGGVHSHKIKVRLDGGHPEDAKSAYYYATHINSTHDDIKDHIAGEHIEVKLNHEYNTIKIPVKPGYYSGVANFRVELLD